MKIAHIALLAFTLPLTLYSYTNHKAESYSLTVEVNNLRNSNGIVQFALYNMDGTIPDEFYKKSYKILKGEIINGSAVISFKDLPTGKYAVNILHDENNNGKIDKGFILPIEGIGFSNYQTIGLGNRPNFSKASFELTQNKTIIIKAIYL
ncbi:MAG TPA: DUF2141 domain-containing protein [Bacteroidia bacterium]|nr:DUF2141 domain-containing protein [Bacteroidia bacterium]